MTVAAQRALIEAGTQASKFLELDEPDIATLERLLPRATLALALLMCDTDPEFHSRWQAAGNDWSNRAAVLHDAIVWVVTPEAVLVATH